MISGGMDSIHRSVLLEEVLSYVVPDVGVDEVSLIIDATVGEGGHSAAFLEKYSRASLVGIDADGEILKRAAKRLKRFGNRVRLMNGWYDEILEGMVEKQREGVDIVFFDLGISMFHFVESKRGFSFSREEYLDMRLNSNSSLTAYEVVNRYSESDLVRTIKEYGEERFAHRIAERIVRERKKGEIKTSKELEEIIWRAVPRKYRYGRINPSTKTFQAIRIEVNDELGRLQRALYYSGLLLKRGGVVGVISFHSLEDRIVKKYFKNLSGGFSSEPEKPISIEEINFEPLLKKPITAGGGELEINPASRSAKLRVYRRL